MCLTSVELNLVYDKEEKDFVGFGYKSIDIIDRLDRINYSKTFGLYKSGWNTATGSFTESKINYHSAKYVTKTLNGISTGYTSYWPGYHIFLNPIDAARYMPMYGLVKVMFKGVTSFGRNMAGPTAEPCVIAKHMKIVKVISTTGRKYGA